MIKASELEYISRNYIEQTCIEAAKKGQCRAVVYLDYAAPSLLSYLRESGYRVWAERDGKVTKLKIYWGEKNDKQKKIYRKDGCTEASD